jgi:mannosyltransferase
VVATIHNSEPHVPFDGWRDVFESVYSQCNGLIHHGERSRSWLRESFPEFANLPSVVIPHGNYLCFAGDQTRKSARDSLALDSSDRVVLVFGRTRTRNELRLIGRGLRESRVPDMMLLFSGCFPVRRLAWLRNPMERRLFLCGVRYRLFPGHLAPEEVGLPLTAADLLLIQRQSGLNSGNVALAFSFGLPVVSADVGVFGELVKRHENFTYPPGSVTGLRLALESAFKSDLEAIGRGNRRIAETEWNWELIAERALEFIGELRSC